MPVDLDAVARKVDILWQRSPFGRWQYVDVTFPIGGQDVDVVHTLAPQNPDDVRFLVISRNASTVPYRDSNANRLAWTSGHIWLRASQQCQVRLLLFLERE